MFSDRALDGPFPAGPECIPVAPRRGAWNSKARLRAAATVGLLIGPNAILLGGWATGEDLRSLIASGQITFGRVTETIWSSSRGGRAKYRLRFGLSHPALNSAEAFLAYFGRRLEPGQHHGHDCDHRQFDADKSCD